MKKKLVFVKCLNIKIYYYHIMNHIQHYSKNKEIHKLIKLSKELNTTSFSKEHNKKFNKIISNLERHSNKIWQWVGLLANILMIISLIPSILQIYRVKDCGAFPYNFLFLSLVCNVLFCVYAGGTKSKMTFLMGAVGVVYFGIIFYFKAVNKW